MDRRYGFFECPKCHKHWESSHVYCNKGTDDPLYEQDCKTCRTACYPNLVQKIQCSACGRGDCVCAKEEKQKRHINPNKPHRADLCHKCLSGKPCT